MICYPVRSLCVIQYSHCFIFKATKETAPRLKLPPISVLKPIEDAYLEPWESNLIVTEDFYDSGMTVLLVLDSH